MLREVLRGEPSPLVSPAADPMRIGIVSPFMPHDLADLLDNASRERLPGIRGVLATPVTPIAREWHRHGHHLSVFCLDPSVTQPRVLRGERLSVHVFPKRPYQRCLPDGYRVERRLLRGAILHERPEVISAQWTREHAWAALQCRIPTAVTCHDTPLRYAWISKHWFMWYHVVLAWRVVRKAPQLICVSPYTARHIQRYFRPRGTVDVVPNGLPPEVFQRGQRRLQQETASLARPFTFCSVGHWGPLKNLSVLVKAFAEVRQRQGAAKLALFGDNLGPGQAAEQWARDHRLDQGIEFVGRVSRERILDFLETEADMMVHPSLVETHGMTLIEAMACGSPVIGGLKSGAVAWTLEEGRCGFLCDIRDHHTLASQMLDAMRQPDHNRALAERAWASVARRFPLEATVFAYEEILRRLVAAERVAPHVSSQGKLP
jgi:glycosyltransferase involved in cell wall biosynthesis